MQPIHAAESLFAWGQLEDFPSLQTIQDFKVLTEPAEYVPPPPPPIPGWERPYKAEEQAIPDGSAWCDECWTWAKAIAGKGHDARTAEEILRNDPTIIAVIVSHSAPTTIGFKLRGTPDPALYCWKSVGGRWNPGSPNALR
jgi:hypothetical protein